jgi:hypothetical protein
MVDAARCRVDKTMAAWFDKRAHYIDGRLWSLMPSLVL